MSEIVEAAIRGDYRMLVPEEVLGELISIWGRKKSVHPEISDEQMGRFIRLLRSIAEIVPPSDGPIPYVFRDRKDDFLLTACALGNANYLVTGDRDILDMREKLSRPVVLTVAEFLTLLSEAPQD
jgi:putative PIN family toxin of toxin-antitoxin system